MAQYDGSIRINTNIDTRDLNRGVSSISGSLRSVGGAASSATGSLRSVSDASANTNNSLRSVGDGARSASRSLEDVGDTAEETEEKIEKLNGTIKKLGAVIATAFITGKVSEFKKQLYEAGAELEATESQFYQVFGSMTPTAQKSLSGIADQAGIMEERMKGSYTKIAAFAKTTGMDTASSLELANRAMVAVADSAAFYDRSLEETTESLQSFLKGNYENDAALGLSATETTRNAAANKLYGKSFIELSESQKQFTLLQMVEDANKLSGALGQSAREADTYTNQIGNLNQAWKNLSATVGRIILPQAIETIKRITQIVNTINALVKKIAEAMGWLKPFNELFGAEIKKGSVADSVASSMEDAAKATKKAKKAAEGYLNPLDEINKFKKKDKDEDKDSDTDVGEVSVPVSISEIDYDNAEVDTIADEIAEKFSGIFDMLKEAWESKGQSVVNSAKSAFQSIKKVIKSIIDTWKKLWEDGTILTFLESVLDVFKSIFDVIGSIADAFAKAWTKDDTGFKFIKSILELLTSIFEMISTIASAIAEAFRDVGATWIKSVLDMFTAIGSLIGTIAGTIAEAFRDGTGTEWIESILELFTSINGIVEVLASTLETAWDSGAGLAMIEAILEAMTNVNNLVADIGDSFSRIWDNGTGVKIWTNILGIVEGVANIIGNLALQIQTAWDTAGLGDSIMQGILNIFNTILETIHNIIDSTAEWAAKLDFTPLLESIDGLLKALEPLTENIGAGLEWFWNNVLLPIAGWTIQKAVSTFLDMLSAAIKVLNEVIEALKPLGKWLWEEFLQPLGEWAGDTIIAAMETVTNLLNDFASWISQHQETVQAFTVILGTLGAAFITYSKIIPEVIALFGKLKKAFMAINPTVAIVVAAAVLLVAALSDLWQTSDTFKKSVTDAFEKVKKSLTNAFEKIRKAISPLIDSVKDLIAAFIDFYENSPIKSIVALIASLAATIAGNVISIAIDMISSAFSNFAKILGGAIDIITGVFDILTALFTLDFEKFKEGLGKIKDGLLEAFSGSIGNITMIGTDLIGGLLEGILDAMSTIGSWIEEHVFSPIVDWFKKLFGIHSPSTVMQEYGGYIIEGLLNGIKSLVKDIKQVFTDIKTNITTWFTNVISTVKTEAPKIASKIIDALINLPSDIWKAIKDGVTKIADLARDMKDKAATAIPKVVSEVVDQIKDLPSKVWSNIKGAVTKIANLATKMINKVKEVFPEVVSTITGFFTDLPSKFLEIGGNIVSGLTNGIKNTVSNVTSAASNLAGSVVDKVTGVLQIHSPSRVMETLGEYTTEGLSIGLENGENSIEKWADSIVGIITGGINNSKSWVSSNGMQSVTDAIKEAIKSSLSEIKTIWNSTWEELGKTAFSTFDLALDKINSIKEAIDTLQGNRILGINMPDLSKIPIPQIALGTVVPQNREFSNAITSKREPESISSTDMKQAFMEAIRDMGGLNAGGNGTIVIKQYLDGKQVAESVIKQGKIQQMSSGKNIFMLGGT